MDNSSNHYTNTKNLIYLYLLHKKIRHPKAVKNNSKIEANEIYFIQKKILDKYKDLCHYKELNDFFENNENILKNIDKNKLNENNMIEIIKQIPEYMINKIEDIKEKNLLIELAKENNNQWTYKCLKIDEKKSIKYIDDFGMIDNNLKNKFFKEEKFKVLKGKCIIGKKVVFIYIPYSEKSIYEIGNFDENGKFNIEYLFDQKEIGNSSNLINALIDEGIDSIFTKIINQKKEKKDKIFFKKTNSIFSFYTLNDKNIDTNSNYIINTSLNISIIDKSFSSINGNSINIKKQKKKSNSQPIEPIDKLKCLIILSIFQKKIKKNNSKEQKVFLLNKLYLEQFCFDEVEELINKNAKIKNIFNDKNSNDLSLDLIDTSLLNDKAFKEIKKEISNVKTEKYPICKGTDISLSGIKKIKIFKRFVLINEDLSKHMKTHFGITFEKPYISYRVIKEKDIIINDNQNTIFIGNINFEDHIYNIDYILNFGISQYLRDEFKVIISLEYILRIIKIFSK